MRGKPVIRREAVLAGICRGGTGVWVGFRTYCSLLMVFMNMVLHHWQAICLDWTFCRQGRYTSASVIEGWGGGGWEGRGK